MASERWPTVSGSTYYTTVTAGSTNTKGSYSQLAASTGLDSADWYFQVFFATAGKWFLADVATGAGGAEVVQLSNVLVVNANGVSVHCPGYLYRLNTDVSAGTRLAIRSQCSGGGSTFQAMLGLQGSTLAGRAVPSTYGATTATSLGTSIDPGASSNTKGSYAQLTASSAAAHTRLTLGVGLNQTGPSFATWAADIATGAGGSETVLVPDIGFQVDNIITVLFPCVISFDVGSVASGTRFAMRAQCSINTSGVRVLTAVLVGGTAPATGLSAAIPAGIGGGLVR